MEYLFNHKLEKIIEEAEKKEESDKKSSQKKDEEEMIKRQFPQDIENNISNRNIFERFCDIYDFFNQQEELDSKKFLAFSDWLRNRVEMIPFISEEKEDANLIFQNMNDRGLKLTSVDLFKNKILQKILENKEGECGSLWEGIEKGILNLEKDLNKGKKTIHQKDTYTYLKEEFILTYIKANYAKISTSKEKNKEFIEFETPYMHSWFFQEERTSKEYLEILKNLKEAINWYTRIKKAEKNYSEDPIDSLIFKIYTISKANLPSLGIFSLLNKEKSEEKILSFLKAYDIYLYRRLLRKETLERRKIGKDIYRLISNIRNENLEKLKEELYNFVDRDNKEEDKRIELEDSIKISYKNINKSQMRAILARIYEKIEEVQPSKIGFQVLLKNEYQIDHIFPKTSYTDNKETTKKVFPNEEEFKNNRDNFSYLALIAKETNQKFGKLGTEKKLKEGYLQDKLLINQCLSSDYKISHSGSKNLIENFKLNTAINLDKNFGKNRIKIYSNIASQIWNIENIKK